MRVRRWLWVVAFALGCAARRPTVGPAPLRTVEEHAITKARTPAARDAGMAQPTRGFERVAESDCEDATNVHDLTASTLVVSRDHAYRLEVDQPWNQATDVSAGLPEGRGESWLFTTTPLVLNVRRHSRGGSSREWPGDIARFRYDGARWVEQREDFGISAYALAFESGSIVLSTPPLPPMPTRASWLATDGTVTRMPGWPLAKVTSEMASKNALWAIVARPGRKGRFLMRITPKGEVSVSSIPSLWRCPGGFDADDHLAQLDSATDDSAELTIWDGLSPGLPCIDSCGDRPPLCVARALAGDYRFARGRFARLGPSRPYRFQQPSWNDVIARDTRFVMEGFDFWIKSPTGTEHRELEPREHYALTASAGGREVWLHSRVGEQCILDRYVWPNGR